MTTAASVQPLVAVALHWCAEPSSAGDTGISVPGRTDPLLAGASAADRCALEHGLRLAEALRGRCVAVTVGPPEAEVMLRGALAAGADAALRVQGADDDSEAVAHTLGAVLRDLCEVPGLSGHPGEPATSESIPHLVLCGDRSLDGGTDSMPAFLAARIGAAQALGLVEVSAAGPTGLVAVRRLDRGARERLAVPLPAVCSVGPDGPPLRRAALPAVLASRGAALPVATVPEPPTGPVESGPVRPFRPRPRALPVPNGANPRERLQAITGVGGVRHASRQLVEFTDPASAADALLAELRGHGYLPEEAR